MAEWKRSDRNPPHGGPFLVWVPGRGEARPEDFQVWDFRRFWHEARHGRVFYWQPLKPPENVRRETARVMGLG